MTPEQRAIELLKQDITEPVVREILTLAEQIPDPASGRVIEALYAAAEFEVLQTVDADT